MNPTAIGIIVFAFAFGGVLAGMKLSSMLPEHHLSDGSKDTVKTGIGLIATMSALILGLVTASAKSSFDEVDHAVRHAAGNILTLDRALARYGPEAAPVRENLKAVVASRIETTWPRSAVRKADFNPFDAANTVEALVSQIRGLAPKTDDQRWLQSRARSCRIPAGSPFPGVWKHRSFGARTVPRHSCVLANNYVHELRTVRTAKRDGGLGAAGLRVVGRRGRLPGAGDGRTIPRADYGLA